MSTRGEFRVTAVQATPVYLDREATLDVVVDHVDPGRRRRCRPGRLPGVVRARLPRLALAEQALARQRLVRPLPGPGRRPERPGPGQGACRRRVAGTWVALGIAERSRSGTLYNAVVYIDAGGRIAGLHRKLVPTGAERLVFGNGQGPVLTVVDIGGVRVGSLICWENYMPLARAALYEKGIDVLLAPTWDNSDEWLPTLRHGAKEGQVFVVGVTAHLRGCDVPRDLPGADEMYGGAEDLLSRGNTTRRGPRRRDARRATDRGGRHRHGDARPRSHRGRTPRHSTRPGTTPGRTCSPSPPERSTVMTAFPAIGHVALTVKDLAVSRPWYQRLTGADPVLDEPTDGGFHHIVFLVGETLVGLHEHPNAAVDHFTELRTGLDHLAFGCAGPGRPRDLGEPPRRTRHRPRRDRGRAVRLRPQLP